MGDQKTPPHRRRAHEWARLVDRWKKSGRTVDDFAASHGIAPRTLTWWKWRLGSQQRSAARSEDLRLVPVQIEPEPAQVADASPAWELTAARGQVLRVYRGIAPAELAAVLAAMESPGGRR